MKKLFLSFAVIATMGLVSCGGAKTEEAAAEEAPATEVVEEGAAVVEEAPAEECTEATGEAPAEEAAAEEAPAAE